MAASSTRETSKSRLDTSQTAPFGAARRSARPNEMKVRTFARTPIISPTPKKLRLRTSVGMGMPRRRGMVERKSQCSWMGVPWPSVACTLWRREAGGERACVRGVGPWRARTVLPWLLTVLRGMLW